MATKSPIGGTNFWVAITLAFGGLFVGFPEGEAKIVVESIFAGVAGIFALREKLKSTKIDWKAWIASKNTWNYLGTAIVSIVPAIPLELFQRLGELGTSILGGNWQGIAAAVFSIATILYYLIRAKPIVTV